MEQISRPYRAQYFVEYIRRLMTQKGYTEEELRGGGLRIYTTLDLSLQAKAEKALLEGLPKGKEDENGIVQPQGALIALDPRTGHILAMVGGRGGQDFFNRAVDAERQPGSAIKPFIYTAAVERGYTPGTVLSMSRWSMSTSTPRKLGVPSLRPKISGAHHPEGGPEHPSTLCR